MIALGPLRAENLELYRKWRNDPAIWRWCRQVGPLSEATHKAWFDGLARDPHTRMFEVRDKGVAVGVCGLTSIDWINRRAEFSLYIGPEHHGKGYGTYGLAGIFMHGFDDLGLNVIWGESFEGNPALKLFDQFGMTREGARRAFYFRAGRFIDAVLISITSKEWEEKCKDLKLD